MQSYDDIEENPLNALGDTHEFTDYANEMTYLQGIIEERLRILCHVDQCADFLNLNLTLSCFLYWNLWLNLGSIGRDNLLMARSRLSIAW